MPVWRWHNDAEQNGVAFTFDRRGTGCRAIERADEREAVNPAHNLWRRFKRRSAISAATLSVVMTLVPCMAFAQNVPAGVSNIIPDGRTATTVTTNGSVSTVTTGTISGPNAFNSFSQFQIGAGATGNLILPGGTSNLINLVRDGPAVVNGVLNAYKNGQIGGNVYFADPYGFVVGKSGIVNVGSLSVSTPTKQFMDSVISPSGQINQGAVTNLLAGTVPISPNGVIRIRGRVNAVDAVRLTGQNVFVGGVRDAITRDHALKFASTVNSKGLHSANAIVVKNGSIQIVATNQASINAKLVARKSGGQGGDIVVTAGGAIRIGSNAKLDAKGKSGDAGNIEIVAGANLSVATGAAFDASSAAGSAGIVELSSFGTYNLASGFTVDLGSGNGNGGRLLMDPSDVVIGSTLGVNGVTMTNTDVANAISAVRGSGQHLYQLSASGASITINSDGVINTELVSGGNSTADSLNVELDAANIIVNGKILADAVGTTTFKAGNIDLEATMKTVMVGGDATASTKIDIGPTAQISGANITLNSYAQGISSYLNTDNPIPIAALVLQTFVGSVVGINGGYVSGTATSMVTIEGSSHITGTGDVTITAAGQEQAEDPAITLGGASPLGLAVAVGAISGTVSTTVQSGANISAGGNLTIASSNDATLLATAIGVSASAAMVDTVAWGTASVQTTTSVETGANLSVGNNLSVGALNTNSFSVTAVAVAASTGNAGMAIAYNNNSTSANANLGANVGTSANPIGGSVTVEADSIGSANSTGASAIVGNPALMTGATALSGSARDFLSGLVKTNYSTDLKGAGVVSVTLSSQAANASIAASANASSNPAVYTTGSVAVVSNVTDGAVRSNADSSVNSAEPNATQKSQQQTTAANAVALGVAVGQFEHDSNAFIGSGVTVKAANIGVSAVTDMPISITWLTYDSLSAWLGKLNGNAGVVNQVLTSYANAASQATGLDLTGAVNYFDVTNTTTAWVASSANLTSTATSLAPWSVTLMYGDPITWAQNIAILASTTTASVDIGGNFSWLGLTGNSGQNGQNGQAEADAIGGSANVVSYTTTTIAGVGDDAVLSAKGSINVAATTTNAVFSVGPTSGAGNASSFNGIVDLTLLDDTTHASVANTAQLTAPAVNISATDAMSLYAIAGAVGSSQSDAVGIVIAVNQVDADTQAYVGLNSGDILDSKNSGDDAGDLPGSNSGYVHADALNVDAQTYGIVTAASVAATVASSSPSSGSTFLKKFGSLTGITAALGFSDSSSGAASSAGGGTPPKWSVDISGSSSVNTTSIGTLAYLDGVTVKGDAGINATNVQAVNNTVEQTGAGSAALDFAQSKTTKSAAIAGALAISLSTNQTGAWITGSSVTNTSSVSVLALAGGEQTTVGIGLAINASANQSDAASAAGSISISSVKDGVQAYVANSTITADPSLTTPTYNDAATVAAYQTTNIGIGAGALYAGGKTGFGFAFTYAEIGNPDNGDAVDAHISNSSVTGFFSATVDASDASQIGAGAGLFGYAQNALAVALVVSDISPTTSAVIDGGDSNGSSTIHVSGAATQNYTFTTAYSETTTQQLTDTADLHYTLVYSTPDYFDPTKTWYTYDVVQTNTTTLHGDVTVAANGNRNAAFDAAIAAATDPSGAPVSAGLIDFSGSAMQAANSTSGASIIAVAGVVQGGQNSVGFSITASTIHTSTIASVTHAKVTSDNGDVIVAADSSADILGVALGVAVSTGKFAGLGASSINLIDNAVSATIGDDTATNSNTTVSGVNVVVQATDGSNIRGAAGTLGIGLGNAAAGLSVTYDDIANSVLASINGAKVTSSEDTTVNAASDASTLTVALGIAISKDVGLAGSVAISVLETNVTANITNGATVDATNNVGVLAGNNDSISVLAGAAGIGLDAGGVGLAVVVNQVSGVTAAYIDGSITTVNARAAGTNGPLMVNSGTLANTFDVSKADLPSLSAPDLSETQQSVSGLAVVATSHQAIDGIAVTIGIAPEFLTGDALALVPVTSLMGGTTTAYIQSASIDTGLTNTQTPDIFVGAGSQTYTRNLVLAGSGAGGFSGAGAIAANQLDRTTTAYLHDATLGTSTQAVGDVAVNASSTQIASDETVGLAVGVVGAGASLIVNQFSATTEAYIVGGHTYAGSLADNASSTDGFFAAAGAAGAGALVGVAGAFAVGVSDNTTLAYIGADNDTTNLNVAGDVTVAAVSNNSFYSYAIGGALGGDVAVAGMIDFSVVNNHTQAYLDNVTDTQTATGSDPCNLCVTATENLTVEPTTGAGAIAPGAVGVAAAINVVLLQSQVSSSITDSTVNVPGIVNVAATSTKYIDANTGTFGAGGSVGVAASIGLVLVGKAAPGDALNEISTSVSDVDAGNGSADPNNGIAEQGVPGTSNPAPARPASYSIADALGSNNDAVTAEISGGSTTAGEVDVSATASVRSKNVATGVGLGGEAGVGAALGYTLIYDTVAASVNFGTVTAPKVNVTATMQDGPDHAAEVDAYAGAGSLGAAVGAAVAVATINNTVGAQIGGTITGPDMTQSGTAVAVSATDTSTVNSNAIGAAVSGGGAVGVSNADSTKSSLVYATVLENASVTGYLGMSVSATSSGTVDSSAFAGAGGILFGAVGAGATSVDSEDVIAEIGSIAVDQALGGAAPTGHPSITVGANGLMVQASATPDTSAESVGVSVGSAAVGGSVALANVTANISALVDTQASIVTAGTLTVQANGNVPLNDDSAFSSAVAGTGGFLLGANATDSEATNHATVTAAIGDSVLLPMGDVVVLAVNNTDQSSFTTGVSIGYVALGLALASSTADTTTEATIGASVTTSNSRTGNLVLSASGSDTNDVQAISGVGGVVAGNGADSSTTTNAYTLASIGASSSIVAGTISIVAQHTSIYKATVDSVNASFVGASGAADNNNIDSNVKVDIGSNANLIALNNACGNSACLDAVNIVAENDFVAGGAGDSATGAGGGVLNGSAVFDLTSITGSALIVIEDSAATIDSPTHVTPAGSDAAHTTMISAGTDPFLGPGSVHMVAFSTYDAGNTLNTATDNVTLITGGAIASAGATANYHVSLSNEVDVGQYDVINAYGNVGIGTFTQAALNTNVYVSTFGIAAVGSADTTVDIDDYETVKIKAHALVNGFGNVDLTPGQDFGGGFQSVLTVGTADAEAYVRGLVAIPSASATTNLTSTSSLLIDTDATVQAGQDINIGAYTGSQASSADGGGHGYILFFIPASSDGSHPNTPVVSSTVTINDGATVTAGFYHDQEITIDCGAAACGPNSTPTVTISSGAPVMVKSMTGANNLFDIVSYVTSSYDPQISEVLLTSVANTPVPAFEFGSLYASGGSITVNAGTLTGTGTLTAWGSPKINVVANTPTYLLFDGAYIPDIIGGQINFSGGVTDVPAGMGKHANAGTAGPTINIENDYNGQTGSTGFGPAMLFNGDVTNLGGTITISNVGGSYGTIGNTNAESVVVNAPTGAAVISNPAPGGYFGGTNAFGNFDDFVLNYPGGTPTGSIDALNANANAAVMWVANFVLQPLATQLGTDLSTAAYGTLNDGTQHFGPATSSTIFFSNCIPGYSGSCANGGETFTGIFNGSQYNIGNINGQSYLYTPIVSLINIPQLSNTSPPASSSVQTFGGGNVAVSAAIIDIDAKIVIGRPADQSVVIPLSVQQTLQNDYTAYQTALKAGLSPNSTYAIPGLISATDALKQGVSTAVYDAATNQIVVQDTSASSSGGRLLLNGAIISTTTVGNIQINGGLGNVSIDNETTIPMVINKINTGNADANGNVTSTVKIIDTLKPLASNTTTYVYTSGKGFQTYTTGNGANAVVDPNAPFNTTGSIQYAPATGARLEWVQQAELSRDLTGSAPGQWLWVTTPDQPNNPWYFVSGAALTDPSYSSSVFTDTSNVVSQAHPQGAIIFPGNSAYPTGLESGVQLVSTLTGGIVPGKETTGQYQYSFVGFGGIVSFPQSCACSGSGDADTAPLRTITLPTEVWLKLTTSVKADNPFSVSFSGGSIGSINVVSKAPVTFADQVTNSSGKLSVTAAGSITESPNAFIQTKSLVLDATGGLGAASSNASSIGIFGQPFAATLNGGTVTATAGSGGVYLDISGTGAPGKVVAQDAFGYGDINYTQHGDLLPATGGAAVPINFIGDNITLTSIGGVIGSGATPVVISANSTTDANQIISGGVVNMTAQGDINFTQTNVVSPTLPLDLRLGTVQSLSGDVWVTVTNGALVDSRGQTAASALSSDQVNNIIQILHLTGSDAVQSAIDTSVTPFVNLINTDYGRYFALKASGCTANCTTFSVDSAAIAFYRPLAANALRVASPTDAQVTAYIATLHQQNGTLTLSDSQLAIYQPLALAALKAQSVTPDEVRAYADAQYQSVVTDFTRAYGANWATLPQFTTQELVLSSRLNTDYSSYFALKASGCPTNCSSSAQYQAIVADFTTAYGADWATLPQFATQQPVFSFSINDPSVVPGLADSLTARAVWDPAQIVAAIDQTAFEPVSPTVGNGVANIIGRNVTVNALAGPVGVLAPPVDISLSSLVDNGGGPSLTDTQKAAIAAAQTAGAVTAVGTDAQGHTVSGFSIFDIPAGVTVTGIEINQQAPIFVNASNVLNANATAAAFIQSTGNNNLNIGQVVAGGDVALTATKSLLAATSAGNALFAQQVLAGGGVTLAAGGGDIGSSSLPFGYKADGNLVAAQATGDVYVASYGGYTTPGGDMTIGRIFAKGTASLVSETGGIQGYLGGLAIVGHDVVLDATAGDIGTSTNPLQVQTNGGELSGTASGSAYLYSPLVAGQVPVTLNVASLAVTGTLSITTDFDVVAQNLTTSGGNIIIGSGGNAKVSGVTTAPNGTITATAIGDLELGSLTAPGPITAQSNGAMTIDAGATLTSANDMVSLIGGSLNMQAGSVVTAAGTITVTTLGDAVLGKLISALVSSVIDTAAITVTAGDATHPGEILGNGDGQTNITTVRPNATTILTAESGIGAQDVPVMVDVPSLSASTVTGDIHIAGLGKLIVNAISGPGILDVSAADGIVFEHVRGTSLTFQSNGAIDVEDAQVTTSLTLIGTEITGSVSQTPGSPGPLYVSIMGPNGTPANSATFVIDPAVTIIPQLSVVDISLTNVGPSLTILNGYVPGEMTLYMLGQVYVMNNRSPVPLGWPTVQLYQNGSPFYFSQNYNYTYSSGFIVDYGLFADVTALSAFNGLSFVHDVPLSMWDNAVFDPNSDNSKSNSPFYPIGTSPSNVVDKIQTPKAVEVIGSGPAVNIDGL